MGSRSFVCVALLVSSWTTTFASGAVLPAHWNPPDRTRFSTLLPGNAPPPALRHRVPLSAAYERMLRDEMEDGRALDPRIVERFGLDRFDDSAEPARPDASSVESAGQRILGPGVALAPDAQINDKAADATCSACTFRPLSQGETTIAASSSGMIVGWNNSKGFCTGGAIQGYGYSTDGGATWTDAGDPPALSGGGRYRGDPVHAVNRSTGDFYILGLYEGGASGSGMALARGHFSGASFVIDDNRQIAVGGSNFIDKEWMAVDPGNGYLYVTYSNFIGGTTSQIEMIRSTNNGVSWDPPVVLNTPAANGNVQGSRPVVGPGGVLYVVWYEYGFPQAHMRIRRSDDHGSSFGPERTVCDFYENYYSGAPGFRRGSDVGLPGIAVDNSAGPHAGRLYVTWNESVNFTDAPFSTATAKSEVEKNDFFASATPFTVGDVLRGFYAGTADIDFFKFSGLRGQTIFFETDSATVNTTTNMRLVCGSDTSSFNNNRLLAFDQAAFAALVFTLPADGTYYLRLNPATSALQSYRILTTFDTPSPGERGRDHRDCFVSHSDDGATWSTPAMLNDSAPWFDGEYPEIAVDDFGVAHAYWHDFRDDPVCGAESYEYLVSSGDGGATWGPNRRMSDARSFWSFNTCGSANQGDYQGITTLGHAVLPAWSDSRLGDPDVWTENDRFQIGSSCPADLIAPAGSTQSLTFTISNPGNVTETLAWSLTDARGWITGVAPSSSGSAAVSPGGSMSIKATIAIPSSCPDPNLDVFGFVTQDASIPGVRDSCTTIVRCVSATDVPRTVAHVLFFDPPAPNPSPRGARFRFGLSRSGAVELDVFDAHGARVRALEDGRSDAGEHEIVWDGRDARGRRVAAGVYYAVLDAEGRKLVRPVSVLP